MKNGELVSNDTIMQLFWQMHHLRQNSDTDHQIDRIRAEIINKLSFLVYSQTKQYRGFNNYSDLVQEGFVGLTRAVNKFDCTRFDNFFGFAEQWIRHTVKRAASKFDIVYNPNKIRVVYSEPDDDEPDYSFDLDDIMFDKERAKSIEMAIDNLTEREGEIIKMSYGLGNYIPQTLREIGPKFNLTHERVRQIKKEALKKLQKNKILFEINE